MGAFGAERGPADWFRCRPAARRRSWSVDREGPRRRRAAGPLGRAEAPARTDGESSTQQFDLGIQVERCQARPPMVPLRSVLFDLNGTLVDPVVMAEPVGNTAADEDLVSAAVDDAIQLAMVVTLTGREAVLRRARAGRPAAPAAARRPRSGRRRRRDRADGLDAGVHRRRRGARAPARDRAAARRADPSAPAAADGVAALRRPARRSRSYLRARVGRLRAGPAPVPDGARADRGRRGRRRDWWPPTVGRGGREGRRADDWLDRPARPRAARRRRRSPTSAGAT